MRRNMSRNLGLYKYLLVERYQKVSKLPTNKRENDTFNSEIATFNSLFDVTPCKCYDVILTVKIADAQ